MTDNEIIKALEAYNGYTIIEYAIDLINRQKAEIERLKKNIDGLNIFTTNHMKVIKLQAIREFVEKLKKSDELYNCIRAIGNVNKIDCIIDTFDNLVKEMTEVENDRA